MYAGRPMLVCYWLLHSNVRNVNAHVNAMWMPRLLQAKSFLFIDKTITINFIKFISTDCALLWRCNDGERVAIIHNNIPGLWWEMHNFSMRNILLHSKCILTFRTWITFKSHFSKGDAQFMTSHPNRFEWLQFDSLHRHQHCRCLSRYRFHCSLKA